MLSPTLLWRQGDEPEQAHARSTLATTVPAGWELMSGLARCTEPNPTIVFVSARAPIPMRIVSPNSHHPRSLICRIVSFAAARAVSTFGAGRGEKAPARETSVGLERARRRRREVRMCVCVCAARRGAAFDI